MNLRRVSSGAVALTALLLSSITRPDGAAAMVMQQDTTVQPMPITGAEVKCVDGKAKIYECQNVELLSYLPVKALGAKLTLPLGNLAVIFNGMWGWTDSTTGRDFALLGRVDGTSFVDVTDPVNPKYLGDLPFHEGAQPSYWREMKVYKNYALIVSDQSGPHGVQIFDLTQLRDVKGAPATFKETAHYDGVASVHNIVVNPETGFAYAVGSGGGGETCGGALHMIDIRDPLKPTFAGCYTEPKTGNAGTGYTHDAQCVVYRGPDTPYKGKEICLNSSETAIGIADVTDKKQPKTISITTYPNVSYAHQGWLTEDQRYFFVDDETDEEGGLAPKTRTLVFDVSKLGEPVLVKEFLGTTAATDHNLYILGNYVYQSNYKAGLRVLEIKDPKEPKEVGYFDTTPTVENVPGYAGTWSNYPYFKNGTIGVTSISEGLFVVRFKPSASKP